MVEEAGKEYAEVKTAKDTDSDEFLKAWAALFRSLSPFTTKIGFDKENVRVKPLDRYNLGGSSQRNTVFCLRAAGPKACLSLPTT